MTNFRRAVQRVTVDYLFVSFTINTNINKVMTHFPRMQQVKLFNICPIDSTFLYSVSISRSLLINTNVAFQFVNLLQIIRTQKFDFHFISLETFAQPPQQYRNLSNSYWVKFMHPIRYSSISIAI